MAHLWGAHQPVVARNVDLSTVPKRNSVQLTIYNSEDLTLVRETRTVTFKKGANPLQFSWANTLIDPTSVDLKFLTHADKLDVLDTTFPHDKPQHLFWNVQSEIDGEATIQITYFTSGITWSADYVLIADKDEKHLGFDGYVRVYDNSGEEYEDAQIRLVVGTINLVEKIAQLAKLSPSDLDKLEMDQKAELRLEAARSVMNAPAAAAAWRSRRSQNAAPKSKSSRKGSANTSSTRSKGPRRSPTAGRNGCAQLEAASVPFKIQYRYRPQEYGEQFVRMYLLTNNEESKLGTSPLPDGVVRVFRENGRDGLSYLTEQSVKYIPIGDKIELNLGPDPEVIFELIKLRTSRSDIWFQVNGVNIFHKLDEPGFRAEPNMAVVGWNDHEVYAQRIRNYTSKPIDVEVRRSFDGHVTFRSALEPKLHDFRTVQFGKTVEAGKKVDLDFEIVRRQGHNATQNNVTLEQANVKP